MSAHYIADMTGVVINPMETNVIMALAPAGILVLGTLAGILPAMKAYRTNVGENLVPQT